MTNKELLRKLKTLNQIQPSNDWLRFTRADLVDHIDDSDQKLSFWHWLKEPQMAALAICLCLMVLGGPYLMLKAAQPSVPGDFLYSVKRGYESVQNRVANNGEKAKLQAEFANRRVEELGKVAEARDVEKVRGLVLDVKDNMAGISQYVGQMSKDEAVVVVQKNNKLKKNLDITNQDASDEVQEGIAEVKRAIDDVNNEVLAVLKASLESSDEIATSTPDIEEIIILELENKTETSTPEMIE